MSDLRVFNSAAIADNQEFNPAECIYIEASAGTGKTYTIQQIVARLIFDGTPLEKILIVTFTEKAAGELRDRIREKLNEVVLNEQLVKGVGEKLDACILARFEEELRNVDMAPIFTIHSFCQKTLRENAYDAFRPFEMELIDDKAVEVMIANWVRDKWPLEPGYQAFLKASLACGQKLDDIIKKMTDLLCRAMPSFYLNKDGQIEESVVKLAKLNPCDLSEDEFSLGLARSYDDLSNISEFREIICELESMSEQRWNPGSKTNTRTIGEVLGILKCYGGEDKLYNGNDFRSYKGMADALKRLDTFKKKHDACKEKIESYCHYIEYDFLNHELTPLYRSWRARKLNEKLESYSDMIEVVHQAVMDDECDLREQLRMTYRFAIIDEFQDTNQLQWDIFRRIFMGEKDCDDEHSIYVVGDPKQSIYSFMGADLHVYEEATKYIGNGRLLDTNYRSTGAMIDACNRLFNSGLFKNEENSKILNSIEFTNSKSPENKIEPVLNGQAVSPIWMPGELWSEEDYADCVVRRIIECCSMREDAHTCLRVFDKKNPSELRNVSFRDFAVLARTKNEFGAIENALIRYGVPFTRYKDDKLFDGRECSEWMALLSAIDAPDFSAWNRRLLSGALFTDFFIEREFSNETSGVSDNIKSSKMSYVDHVYYDDPLCDERRWISNWQRLARAQKWAEMQERIYQDTQIEIRLSQDLSRLQELSKLRQIGNYCIEYLYSHRCSIEELIRHLKGLQEKSQNSEDADGNLVARGTDFDAVQLMTIHASKGLEFPVVVTVAGCRGYNDKNAGPYLYHDEVGNTLGFDAEAKKCRKREEFEEWRRLFYVAYTRASSILMIPRYKKWIKLKDKVVVKPEFLFLYQMIETFCASYPECYHVLELSKEPELELRNKVRRILDGITKGGDECLNEGTFDEQMNVICELKTQVPKRSLIQHSYSTLSGKVKMIHVDPMEERQLDTEDGMMKREEGDSERTAEWYLEPSIDTHPVHVVSSHRPDMSSVQGTLNEADFPKGTQLGNAMHEILEMVDFKEIGGLRSETDAQNHSGMIELVNRAFMKFGLYLNGRENWLNQAIGMVWHTLNAKLPVIHGGIQGSVHHRVSTEDVFSLNELAESEHFAEVEFMLLRDLNLPGMAESGDKYGEHFCKGYIDLIFMRRDDEGNEWYSILDWKSDQLPDDEYGDAGKVKKKVDMEYAVQRVLYSYCLIQWLCGFGKYGNDPKEVFERHFGGIYYAFVRGCRANTSCGIYAQTWESYEVLEKCYRALTALMFSRKPEEKMA